ncbi:MAG: hypothetical protein QF619_13370, partial [Candidatus Binatia bacterium]|nr:hypothetical protein [Candidatus Binatia bacterium]
ALIEAVHAANISGDFDALGLCIEPRYRDRCTEAFASLSEYARKVKAAAKLIEEKLGREIANRFRRKFPWLTCGPPLDYGGKKGQIQWKRIDIRVEDRKARMDIDGRKVFQAIQNPGGRWFLAGEGSPQTAGSDDSFLKAGIEEIDKIIRKLNAGQDGEEYVLEILTEHESSRGRGRTEAVVNARTAELLPRTKAVGAKGLRMLPASPFEAGGFIASVTIESELKNCELEVIYAHPVDTEVSISIDSGKPIKVKLPKTPQGGKAPALASAKLGPLSKGRHKVHVYATHSSGVSQLDWVQFVRTWEREEADGKHQAGSLAADKSRRGRLVSEARFLAVQAKLLPGTTAVGLIGVRMLPARPFEAGGLVGWVTIKSELKKSNSYVTFMYAHPVDTEVSISIDAGKPIKVRLPKTQGVKDHIMAHAALGPLSKGKHKVHVYAIHDSGVSSLAGVMFGRWQPRKKTVAP